MKTNTLKSHLFSIDLQKLSKVSVIVVLAIWQSACVRTRSQIKAEETSNPNRAQAVAPVQDVPVNLDQMVEEMRLEQQRLAARVDAAESVTNDISEKLTKSEAWKALEKRVTDLEVTQLQTLEIVKKLNPNGGGDGTRDADPKWIEVARKKFEEGDFAGAIEHSSAIINSKKNKDQEEATFLRGESYLGLQKYESAIQDFSEFTKTYGKSKRASKALLRIGICFESLGQANDAKPFYQEILDTFPKSREAKEAKKYLSAIQLKSKRK